MDKKKDLLNKINQAREKRFLSTNNKKITSSKTRAIRASKINRPVRVPTSIPHKNCFISGGLGDVLAVESFLTKNERDNLEAIYYATNKSKYIKELFNSLKNYNYPKLKEHHVVWDDFSEFWCFYSLEQFSKTTDIQYYNSNNCLDLSILKIFNEINTNKRHYNESSFLGTNLADVDYLNLPNSYFVILPYSSDKRMKSRDFNDKDWSCIDNLLKTKNKKGIVINEGNDPVPVFDGLINLSNKLTIPEAIEVLKKSDGYFGIDSWLSVLAAKLFNFPNLQIKSLNQHCYDNAAFYFAPQKKFNFMVEKIKIIYNK